LEDVSTTVGTNKIHSMPVNKHALIRYNTLDKCFRNIGVNYVIDDLLDECNTAIFTFDTKSDGIEKRQLYEDIRFMKSEQGWNIELEEGIKLGRKKLYRYLDPSFSISNQPLNETDANHLRSALLTLSRFKGSPQFEWVEELTVRLNDSFNLTKGDDVTKDKQDIISFEENKYLKGKEYISNLYDAIHYKKVLEIQYKSFKSDHINTFTLSPYYLKQFNNRWFLFGQDERYQTLTNLALDRIEKIKETSLKYLETDINFSEYFEDIIGVSLSDDPVEKVVLRIDKQRWPYVNTKPLHGSQKKITVNDDYTDISLEVIPNNELDSLILQFGDKMLVLEPDSLKQRIKEKINILYNKYLNDAQ